MRRSSSRRLVVRLVFAAAGLGFLVAALASSNGSLSVFERLTWGSASLVVVVSIGVPLANSRAWAVLIDHDHPSVRQRFYEAQPARYVPGGIAHPIGQMALTQDLGVARGRVMSAFVVQALCSAIAAAVIAAIGLGLSAHLPLELRLMLSSCGLASLLLRRRNIGLIVGSRALGRFRIPAEDLPTQGSIMGSFGFSLLGFLFAGTAVWLLTDGSVLAYRDTAGAFAVGWLAGFLAVPVPAGLGVREGAMAAALSGSGQAEFAVVVGAALAYRVLAMVVELLVFLASRKVRLL